MSRQPTLLVCVASALAAAGCATPATKVAVPTVPMEQALQASIAASATAIPQSVQSQLVYSTVRPDRPVPLVAAPDVRLAFIYPWVDAEGTLHLPNWVAIPVRDFRWVVPDRGTVPMDGTVRQMPPADPLVQRVTRGQRR